MYWPAVKIGQGKVRYDNGEEERVKREWIVPHDQEVMHGQVWKRACCPLQLLSAVLGRFLLLVIGDKRLVRKS